MNRTDEEWMSILRAKDHTVNGLLDQIDDLKGQLKEHKLEIKMLKKLNKKVVYAIGNS